jgi:hypothetical protein
MNMRRNFLIVSMLTVVSFTPLAYGASQPFSIPSYSETVPLERNTSPQLATQHHNTVPFVTGGIGEEERQAMDSVRRNYNVHVMNSERDGAFSGEVLLTIKDRNGAELLTTQAGPLLHAQLPAGRYTVIARNGEETQTKSVKVGKASGVDMHFVWK